MMTSIIAVGPQKNEKIAEPMTRWLSHYGKQRDEVVDVRVRTQSHLGLKVALLDDFLHKMCKQTLMK